MHLTLKSNNNITNNVRAISQAYDTTTPLSTSTVYISGADPEIFQRGG